VTKVPIKAGEQIRIQDANGDWFEATAVTGIEGTHRDGCKIHDFPVIWIEAIGNNGQPFRAPWPREYVQRRP
jgi:hypothetical protein